MMDEPEINIDSAVVMDEDDTVCNICFAEFLDIEDLQTHTVQVHLTDNRKLRFCETCTKIFPDIEQYMSHVLHEHLASLKCCRHCFRLFPDLNSKMLHEKKHKFRCKKVIFCSQCNECFNDKIFLERHEFNAHLSCGEGIMLNHGFSILSSLLNMNVRRFLSGYNEDMTYVCACCQFTTLDMDAYINHFKLTACRTYSCDICLNVYLKRKNLIRHFSSRHGHSDKFNIVECPKCQVMYTRSALKVHEKTCSQLKCFECNITFESVSEITTHKVQVHEECILVEKCRFCYKQVIGQDMMKKHIERSHHGTLHLYKYKCVYCDLIFKHPKKLFGHFFSRHKELEPYTCKICNQKYRIRKNFTLHVHRVHKGVGFLEFNENFHVTFSAEKSGKSFVPQSMYFDSIVIDSSDEGNKTKGKDTQNKDEDSTDIDKQTKKDTDNEKPKTHKLKRKRAKKVSKESDYSSDDSDVPLQKLCKVRKVPRGLWNATLNKKIVRPKNKFVCDKCNKNCYTAQNYKYHMNLHDKRSFMKCIKCEAKFRSGNALKRHIEEKHTNSVLTETLKKVLERRKMQHPPSNNNNSRVQMEVEVPQRFRVALKKVAVVPSETPARMTPVEGSKKISVKNFIENFVPDANSDNLKVKDCVTMGITSQVRPPKIALHRCDLRPMRHSAGLKKPIKFTDTKERTNPVMVRFVHCEVKRAKLNYGEKLCTLNKQTNVLNTDHSYCEEYYNDSQDDHFTNDDIDYRVPQIPEVAQEVMLATEEKPQQTIMIQNVPKEYKSIRIGTLQAEAPYYKIMKIDDIIKDTQAEEVKEDKYVNLPDGTQLVAVNPLAHLIDSNDIKEKMPKKYYQPKKKDIGAAIKKFLNARPRNRSKNHKNIVKLVKN